MDNNQNYDNIQENVIAGVVGAFLFSLVGGILWFVLYAIGYIASISGLVGVICAIKGYSIFAKKESTKGIVIATVIAVLVIVVAWYFGIGYEIYDLYRYWFETGEVEFTVTFFDAVWGVPMYLFDPEYTWLFLKDLLIGLMFCVFGAGGYVINEIRNSKAKNKVVKKEKSDEANAE